MSECYACLVGVATGPESHAKDCVARNIPMPKQDGQWGPEWDEYDRRVAEARREDRRTERDRAIEVGAQALARHVNDREPDDGAYDLAAVVVDALLALDPPTAPVDWPARFRAAAGAADEWGWFDVAASLRNLAIDAGHMNPHVVEAIGRELLGGAS